MVCETTQVVLHVFELRTVYMTDDALHYRERELMREYVVCFFTVNRGCAWIRHESTYSTETCQTSPAA